MITTGQIYVSLISPERLQIMNSKSAFEFHLPGYSLRTLQEADMEALQHLCEACADYFWIVDGEDVAPTAAEELFSAGPPGKSLEDKFLFGLFDQQGELAAVLEGCKHYPVDATWWIGLLLLAPAARGRGLGKKLIDAFRVYVQRQGGAAIMLGVVEDNQAAYAFWQRLGFTQHSKRDPRWFGKKLQAVTVLRLAVSDDEDDAMPLAQRS